MAEPTAIAPNHRVEAGQVIDRLIRQIRDGSWFAAVCEPLEQGEIDEARIYLDGLGMPGRDIVRVEDWRSAKQVADSPDWDQKWWSTEQELQARLYSDAAGIYGEIDLLGQLTRVTDAAATLLHGPAAVAAARSGVADQGLSLAAAGAAAQSCYQVALSRLTGQGPGHSFESKFRLYLAGRWPLSINKNAFHLF